ncbi:MAG TPA: spermidine/putrescine ABC transporter substrate-binding protein, partial [Chloroflexia bacterium]|nr:spermidine/putrescine ABC transporter substrate-binding protein [Chloroflexia bacterium]
MRQATTRRRGAGLLLFALAPLLAACGADATPPPPLPAPTATPPAIPTGTAGSPASTSPPASATPALALATPTLTSLPVTAVPTLAVDKSKLAGELNLYTWANYMKPAVLQEFQQEYGVKVNMTLYDSNETLLAKLQANPTGYDVIVPSDYMIATMIQSALLAPLDMSLLPNAANLDPRNLHPYYDPENKYSLPWKWGTTGFAYDADKVQPAPDSWAVLFDPQYKGKITMLNDEREVPAAAAHLLGFSENTTDPGELAQIKAKLLQQKPLVQAYTSDTNRDLLTAGTVWLAQIYTGDALKVAETRPSVKYVIPKEGATIWQDNLAIPKGAPHPYTAYVFMNFLLRPDVESENVAFIKYATPNKAAQRLLPPAVLGNPAV